jgi:hypothetical protein
VNERTAKLLAKAAAERGRYQTRYSPILGQDVSHDRLEDLKREWNSTPRPRRRALRARLRASLA